LLEALGITAQNVEELHDLLTRSAIEGEVVQQDNTAFGQVFKVDWAVPSDEDIILRSLWEITSNRPYPRLVSAFIK